jgi:hypothetical protein
MLAITRPSAPDAPFTRPDVQEPIRSYPLLFSHRRLYIKKLMQPWLRSVTGSTVPHTRLSLHRCRACTAAVTSPREAAPTRLLLSPPPRAPIAGGTGCALCRGAAQPLTGARTTTRPLSSSFSTAIAQPDLARFCRKHMLQAYVSSVSDISEVYCKCFRWMLQK